MRKSDSSSTTMSRNACELALLSSLSPSLKLMPAIVCFYRSSIQHFLSLDLKAYERVPSGYLSTRRFVLKSAAELLLEACDDGIDLRSSIYSWDVFSSSPPSLRLVLRISASSANSGYMSFSISQSDL